MSLKTFPGPGAPVEERISLGSRAVIAREIELAGGNEVFFLASLDESSVVLKVEVLARGNLHAVPAASAIAEAGDVVIHNHPNGLLVPSEADLAVASDLGTDGVGFYIVDNLCTRVYAVVEPRVPEGKPDPLDPDEVAAVFAPDGPLAASHPNFEERPIQGQMASDVAKILDSDAVGILEAGTGTGKSLAYLVPAALWALKGNRRVAVSTRTINLQEQILEQDLPILEESLGLGVKAALVKGRGNYCCLRKRDLLEGEEGGTLLEFDDFREIRQIMEWSRLTADGSLSDLSFVPENSNWSLIKSETDSCMRARCTHFSECFFYRARLKASSAQLLLANHHILFADLSLREGGYDSVAIMPRYDAVIMDEAHNVQDVAVSYFDVSLTRWGLMGHLGRLVNRRKTERGLIPFLEKRVGALGGSGKRARERLKDLLRVLTEEIGRVRPGLDELFQAMGDDLLSWLGKENAGSKSKAQSPKKKQLYDDPTPDGDGGGEYRWRISLQQRNELPWQGIQGVLEEMISLVGSVITPLRKVSGQMRDMVDEGFEDLEGVWGDVGAVFGRLEAAVQLLERILEGEEPEQVFWVQVLDRGGRKQVGLHLTPLNVAPILESTLFSQGGPVVMTSATLSVSGSFGFFDNGLGISDLPDRDIRHGIYQSPFDLRQQMRLTVLDSLPDPGNYGFTQALSECIGDIIFASGGGALILFTSYRTLSAVYEKCLNRFGQASLRLMQQGEAPRSLLLERFRADPDSVLFATDSFWEGVDVVGSSLRLVILARLPFPVPSDPINEARGELLVQQGKDPFFDDSLPRAVIRFRQGIGRLIRHRFDRGYAVVCDGRIVRRHYGKAFLDSMGEVEVSRIGPDDLSRDIEDFLWKGKSERKERE